MAVDVEAGGELGGIGDGDLDEDEVLIVGEVVIPQDLPPLLGVLGRRRGRRVRWRPAGRCARAQSRTNSLGGGVELDVGDAELERPGQPGRDRHDHDAGDEHRRDGDAVGVLR